MENSIKWQDKAFSFFQNRKCEYFPCHPVNDWENFNCLFCFCPLHFRNDCGGACSYLENGNKDCSGCVFPHKKENYGLIMERLYRPITSEAKKDT